MANLMFGCDTRLHPTGWEILQNIDFNRNIAVIPSPKSRYRRRIMQRQRDDGQDHCAAA
jgi:hypothetical protein